MKQMKIPMPTQDRNQEPEPMAVYEAVLFLRDCGHRVYRRGNGWHRIDGRSINTRRLLALAKTLGHQ